ncbi:unnamed protein product, partial [Polarella glacialis]
MALSLAPLDTLCHCFEFFDLLQRLTCEAASRRWREAVQDPCLWTILTPRAEELGSLGLVLKRFGRHVRRLEVRASGPHRYRSSLSQLSMCQNLQELSISGLRGSELQHFCRPALQVSSLRALCLDCDPYFSLGSFSHQTGSNVASLPTAWLKEAFPALERLSCHYLE